MPFQASKASWCSQGHFITAWNLQVLQTDLGLPGPANDFLGRVSAVCDDGYELDYVSYSYDSDLRCKGVREVNANLLPQTDSLTSPSGFTSITYRWVPGLGFSHLFGITSASRLNSLRPMLPIFHSACANIESGLQLRSPCLHMPTYGQGT